ncbi:CYTH domain-containing protein [Flagellimonas sp.]|uniref:CYTH domain-containing protein n=1 Tax=Flagellimonas sp. TaxID=2058762 RepID=UPI003F49F58A
MEHLEIERKFLVKSLEYREQAASKTRIVQGFLNTHPDRTVRIRIQGDYGFLTVKGKSNDSGTSRFEWEKKIEKEEAFALMAICEPGIIDKHRYEFTFRGKLFEIDEFLGDNSGLIIAELELKYEDETFEKPPWLGKEVTGEIAYYNSQLVKKPYNQWKT